MPIHTCTKFPHYTSILFCDIRKCHCGYHPLILLSERTPITGKWRALHFQLCLTHYTLLQMNEKQRADHLEPGVRQQLVLQLITATFMYLLRRQFGYTFVANFVVKYAK